MDKDPVKVGISVNFDKNVELNEYSDGWDDDGDEDSDDNAELGLELTPIPKNESTTLEKIPLNEMHNVKLRCETKKIQIPIQDKIRGSMRRGSLMARRATIYDAKPDDFTWDPTLTSPMEARVITDICCFMLFFVFLAIWVFSTCLVFNMGNLERLAVPKNSHNKICGVEELDKLFELNFNLFQCLDTLVAFKTCETKSVCVELCPEKSFSFPYWKELYNKTEKPPKELIENIHCRHRNDFEDMASVENAINVGECAAITTKSFNKAPLETLKFKCVPDILETEIDFIVDLVDNIAPQTNIPWRITYAMTKRLGRETLYTLSNVLQGPYILIGFLITALAITVILVYSMKYLAKYIFIITNIFNAVILITAIWFCFNRGFVFEEFSTNIFHNNVWGLLLIFTSTVAIVVCFQLIIERRGTFIILELIKETTSAIQYVKTLLVFPLIYFCFRAAVIILSMYIGFTIKSTTEPDFKLQTTTTTNASCGCLGYSESQFCNPAIIQDCQINFPKEDNCKLKCLRDERGHELLGNIVNFTMNTNLVGYFWASEYLYLFEHAILASTFATYYWTFHKVDIPRFTLFNGLYTCIRYHLGTVFFAWLFLCVYSYIRFEFGLIDYFLSFLPFSIIHFFFKYVVIVMALCGDDFYDSAQEVVRIVKTNARLIIISKFMSEILFFYLKLLITAIMGAITFLVVLCFESYFQHKLFPVYIVCMGTYLIATEIFNIYILGVDTFTFCYIEDFTLNKGDLKSPYFMPRSIQKLCNVKNTLDKASYDNHTA